jgi:transcriptional regulator with XRE-family HTH domain
MPGTRTTGVRRNEQQWAEILRRFDSSGLSVREFCSRDGVALSSLQRWQRRQRAVPAAKFVELVSPAPTSVSAPTWSFEVSLPNGASLRFQA